MDTTIALTMEEIDLLKNGNWRHVANVELTDADADVKAALGSEGDDDRFDLAVELWVSAGDEDCLLKTNTLLQTDTAITFYRIVEKHRRYRLFRNRRDDHHWKMCKLLNWHNDKYRGYLADFVDWRKHKWAVKTIMKSRLYQLSSRKNKFNTDDEIYNSHATTRLLGAEQLLDAICQVTGVPEKFMGVPPGTRAVDLPDPPTNRR